MSEIAMIGGEPLAAGVIWFLDTFMTPLVNKAKAYDQANKEERRYRAAAEVYRESLLRHYGKIKIFGTSSEVPLQEIFADVYNSEEPHC